MTPRDRADRARQLLDDPVFQQAMRDIRERIVAKLEAVPLNDVEVEHELVLTLQLLQRIPSRFQAYADEQIVEKHAEKQTNFIEKMKQRYRA